MKSTLISLIVALVKQLVGSELWTVVSNAVSEQDKTEKSSSEKYYSVANTVSNFSGEVAVWLVNLAIEAAVAKLRVSKSG